MIPFSKLVHHIFFCIYMYIQFLWPASKVKGIACVCFVLHACVSASASTTLQENFFLRKAGINFLVLTVTICLRYIFGPCDIYILVMKTISQICNQLFAWTIYLFFIELKFVTGKIPTSSVYSQINELLFKTTLFCEGLLDKSYRSYQFTLRLSLDAYKRYI